MFKIILILSNLTSLKLSIIFTKFVIRLLTLIERYSNDARIFLKTYLLFHLEKKFLNSKTNFNKVKIPLKKVVAEKQNKDLIVRNNSTWANFNFRSFLISIDHKSERCQSTLNKLNNLGLKPDIFIGKTPKNITEFLTSSHIISASKPSQIACFISHLLAIKNALNNFDDDTFLILEDDVILFPNPSLVGLEKALENQDWEVLQLEHWTAEGIRKYIDLYNKGVLLHRWRREDYGNSAYLIRRKYAERLINYFFGLEDNMRVDLQKCYVINGEIVSDRIIYENALSLVFTFPLCYQDPSFKSSIVYNHQRRIEIEKEMNTNLVKKLWNKYI